MKKHHIFILVLILLSGGIHAQNIEEGEIKYKTVITLDVDKLMDSWGEEDLGVSNTIIGSTIENSILFCKEKALSQFDVESLTLDDNELFEVDEWLEFISGLFNTIYYDLSANTQCYLEDQFGEALIITDSLDNFNWKISGERENILGRMCLKATYNDDGEKITAWFCPQMPLPLGPAYINNLPGIVLKSEIIVDGAATVTTIAQEIIETPTRDRIIRPSGGKECSSEELDKMLEERFGNWEDEDE